MWGLALALLERAHDEGRYAAKERILEMMEELDATGFLMDTVGRANQARATVGLGVVGTGWERQG